MINTEVSKIKKKILFGITSLDFGGAERVLVDLANKISNDYDVRIFTIYGNGGLLDDLNPKVKVRSMYQMKYTDLSRFQRLKSTFKILFFGRYMYKKYIMDDSEVQIAFLEGPITRLFSNNKEKKKIAWIHNDIKNVFGNSWKSSLKILKKKIDHKVYKKYDRLVFVSKDNMESFKSEYEDISSDKMSVIYNYLNADLVREKAENGDVCASFKNDKNLKFVSVCRLVEQKAIDRFVNVHSKLIKDGYKHTVYIIGDGPEHSRLKELIQTENVEDTFILLGKNKNPYPYIKQADFFCLLSYYEGYGMVIEEAKILNKKIIITNTAAREALADYDNSIIIDNDENGIYEGIKNLVVNKNEFFKNDNYVFDNSNCIGKVIELIEK